MAPRARVEMYCHEDRRRSPWRARGGDLRPWQIHGHSKNWVTTRIATLRDLLIRYQLRTGSLCPMRFFIATAVIAAASVAIGALKFGGSYQTAPRAVRNNAIAMGLMTEFNMW